VLANRFIMNFKINITKVNVTENAQSDLTYYIATLFVMGVELKTQHYTTFNITTINNVNDAVNLISLKNTNDAKDKGEILRIALLQNLVDYSFDVDADNEYTNDYGEFKVIEQM